MTGPGLQTIGAFIFDMDGVVTNTADAHFAAWKAVFDQMLRRWAGAPDDLKPFEREDYLVHVDGVPRHEGVRRFLASRGIDLADGHPDDRTVETARGIANLKNDRFFSWLERHDVPLFADARALIGGLRCSGVRVGVFSASRNARRVLDRAHVACLFEVVVDGVDAAELGLPGKPDPAMLVETARRLGCAPQKTVVIEDALLGVEAGARGHFALVIGVNRRGDEAGRQRAALRAAGADLVVRDLRRVMTDEGTNLRTVNGLPSALDRTGEIMQRIGAHPLAVFLDYDGTLTPIVRDFRKADISRKMVAAIAGLAALVPTAVISGRALGDVRERVGLNQVFYAGSHGFEIAGPGGLDARPNESHALVQTIEEAADALVNAIRGIDGAEIERKGFSLAVHFRNAAAADAARVERAVESVVAGRPTLRRSRGKKVFEVQPRVGWDKGQAVEWLLNNTRLGAGGAVPLYIGDDLTDEDAFAAVAGRGISIIVRGGDRVTTADYALDDSDSVCRLLNWLTERIAEPAP